MEEPNVALRWAIYHFAGGDAFLCGLLVFAVCHTALLTVRGPRRRWFVGGTRLGMIWAVADPSPVPWPVAIVFLLISITWVFDRWRDRKAAAIVDRDAVSRREITYRLLLSGCAVVMFMGEVPHRWFQRPVPIVKTLCIVADSITAGLNDDEETWPRRLSRQVDAQILDASQPGATLKSARDQVEQLRSWPTIGQSLSDSSHCDVLLLEIGGNDLLEWLPLADFERDLDQLLSSCQFPDRITVMFELPLPPLAMRYGEIQRRLARRHQVRLIPRQHLLDVLTEQGSTVDGIHLAAAGHARLADVVRNLLNFSAGSTAVAGDYRHLMPSRSVRQ